MTENPAPPALNRPEYHVWMTPDTDDLDAEPEYVGVIVIRNVDQLTAETQAKGLRISLRDNFHLTNLWIWSAMVRLELTADKFHPFTKRMEYRPTDKTAKEAKAAEPDPTFGGETPSTASD